MLISGESPSRAHDSPHASAMGRPLLKLDYRPSVKQVAILLACLGATQAGAGRPLSWLALTMTALALALAQSTRDFVERLPAVFVLSICATSLVPLLAGFGGWRPLAASTASRGALVAISLSVIAIAWRRPTPQGAHAKPSLIELSIASVPAVLMAALGSVMAATPLGPRISWALSGDHLRHLALVTRTIDSGALEYETQSYPRAWHSATALLWASAGAARNAEGLESLIRINSLLTWTMLTLIPLSLGLTAAALQRGAKSTPIAAGAAGLVAGSLVLGPAFYGEHVPRGFQTSLLGLLILAALVLQIVTEPEGRVTLLTCTAGSALLAHTWPPLLPAVAVLLALVLRSRWSRARGTGGAAKVVALLAAAAMVASPAVWASAQSYGLDAAAYVGDVPPFATLWFGVVLMALAFVARQVRRKQLGVIMLPIFATIGTALLLAVIGDVSFASYYPNKTAWTGLALGLPVVGVAVVRFLNFLDQRKGKLRGGLVIAGAIAALMTTMSLAGPITGVFGSWGLDEVSTVLRTTTSETAPQATVVWGVGTESQDATSQLLLDFYTATAMTAPLGLAPRSVEAQCALLLAAKRPLILSEAPERSVRERFACVPASEVRAP